MNAVRAIFTKDLNTIQLTMVLKSCCFPVCNNNSGGNTQSVVYEGSHQI